MIDYLIVKETLGAVHASIESAILQIQGSGAYDRSEKLESWSNQFQASHGMLLKKIDGFAKNSEKYSKIINDMSYGFKEKDLAPDEPKQCIFPSNGVKEFIGLINEIDAEIYALFGRVGEAKSEILRIGSMRSGSEGNPYLRARIGEIDAALDRLIESRELFYHPLDEIENSLPFELADEDRHFISLLMKCTTDFAERLEVDLGRIRNEGRPYNL